MIDIVFPGRQWHAIEERYASWQAELILRRGIPSARWIRIGPESTVDEISASIQADFVLLVTSPLILPSESLLRHLRDALEENPDATAAVPVLNLSAVADQHQPPTELYLTLRQLEETARAYEERPTRVKSLVWRREDPTVALVRRSVLGTGDRTRKLSEILDGQTVAVAERAYVHRFAAHRGQFRQDLLALVDPASRSILEFGCGEGSLGEAIKKRQQCRVVGVELDPSAAAMARKRLDHVYEGDVGKIVDGMEETFDFIVGGDILEHIDDPWTFLQSLRRVAAPGGRLLLSVPNISAGPIVADLLRGRFDYVYMGILCAGHVRFFTRQTVRDMLDISGWKEIQISDQEHFRNEELEKIVSALAAGNVPHSPSDLYPLGHYVLARHEP